MKIEAPRLEEPLTVYDELPDEDEITGGMFEGIDMDHLDLHGVEFRSCRFVRCTMRNCDLRGAGFTDVVFDHCDLAGARMERTALIRCEMTASRLTGADMIDAVLRYVTMSDCSADFLNFSSTKLDTVSVTGTSLKEASLTGVQMKRVAMDGCTLDRAVFHQTPMKGMDMTGNRLHALTIGFGDLRGMIVTQEQAAELALLLGLEIRN